MYPEDDLDRRCALMALKMARADGIKEPGDREIEEYAVSAAMAVAALDIMTPSERKAIMKGLSMKITGDYTVTKDNLAEAATVTEVGGWLDVSAENASLPVLTEIGGDLYIHGANASFPVLTEVGGRLGIYAEDASLPALTEVGGMKWEQPTTAQQRERLIAVAKAALAAPDALNMFNYHTCKTTHCIAGWAIVQAGEHGEKLEKAMGSCSAGLALLGLDMAPRFFTDNETARLWLEQIAALAPFAEKETI